MLRTFKNPNSVIYVRFDKEAHAADGKSLMQVSERFALILSEWDGATICECDFSWDIVGIDMAGNVPISGKQWRPFSRMVHHRIGIEGLTEQIVELDDEGDLEKALEYFQVTAKHVLIGMGEAIDGKKENEIKYLLGVLQAIMVLQPDLFETDDIVTLLSLFGKSKYLPLLQESKLWKDVSQKHPAPIQITLSGMSGSDLCEKDNFAIAYFAKAKQDFKDEKLMNNQLSDDSSEEDSDLETRLIRRWGDDPGADEWDEYV